MVGGVGADVFVFTQGFDRIADFEDGVDMIDLTGAAVSLRAALMAPDYSVSVAAGGWLMLGSGADTLAVKTAGDSAITLTGDDFLF